jgi:hypothetical protein
VGKFYPLLVSGAGQPFTPYIFVKWFRENNIREVIFFVDNLKKRHYSILYRGTAVGQQYRYRIEGPG